MSVVLNIFISGTALEQGENARSKGRAGPRAVRNAQRYATSGTLAGAAYPCHAGATPPPSGKPAPIDKAARRWQAQIRQDLSSNAPARFPSGGGFFRADPEKTGGRHWPEHAVALGPVAFLKARDLSGSNRLSVALPVGKSYSSIGLCELPGGQGYVCKNDRSSSKLQVAVSLPSHRARPERQRAGPRPVGQYFGKRRADHLPRLGERLRGTMPHRRDGRPGRLRLSPPA